MKTNNVKNAPKTKGTNWARQRKGKTSLVLWDIPADVKRDFKQACANKDVTMVKCVTDFMRQYATRHA